MPVIGAAFLVLSNIDSQSPKSSGTVKSKFIGKTHRLFISLMLFYIWDLLCKMYTLAYQKAFLFCNATKEWYCILRKLKVYTSESRDLTRNNNKNLRYDIYTLFIDMVIAAHVYSTRNHYAFLRMMSD